MRRLWPWFVWLLCFYGSWLTIVIVGDRWQTLREHWGIAVAMAFGSYVAGSTPMGGGTVGFPILVLLFDLPATLGRDLCLGQFVWTMHEEYPTLGWMGVGIALCGVALANLGFEWLWKVGDRFERRSVPMRIKPAPTEEPGSGLG